MGFVFLQQIAASTLYNVTYSGIPTNQACFTMPFDGMPLLDITSTLGS